MAKTEVHFASFWRRFFAYLLDSIVLLFVLLAPLVQPFKKNLSGLSFSEMLAQIYSSHYIILTFVIVLFVLLYWSILECWFGQTLGKMIFGIVVEGSKRKPVSYLQCFIRNVTKLSSVLLFFDTLYMFITHKKRRYFEILSDTQVVVQEVEHE